MKTFDFLQGRFKKMEQAKRGGGKKWEGIKEVV
jgi:hypothetical protein